MGQGTSRAAPGKSDLHARVNSSANLSSVKEIIDSHRSEILLNELLIVYMYQKLPNISFNLMYS